jgi:hypothetical protein
MAIMSLATGAEGETIGRQQNETNAYRAYW